MCSRHLWHKKLPQFLRDLTFEKAPVELSHSSVRPPYDAPARATISCSFDQKWALPIGVWRVDVHPKLRRVGLSLCQRNDARRSLCAGLYEFFGGDNYQNAPQFRFIGWVIMTATTVLSSRLQETWQPCCHVAVGPTNCCLLRRFSSYFDVP